MDALDRYRLAVNGRTVSVGDTPWDAETYDVTALLQQGSNTLTVTADAETPNSQNCFIWLRHPLPAPASFARLSFKTRGARADEWLYVEVVDAHGRTSGFYCVERKRPDLMLGHSGKKVEHVIALGKEPTLDYRPQSGDGGGPRETRGRLFHDASSMSCVREETSRCFARARCRWQRRWGCSRGLSSRRPRGV